MTIPTIAYSIDSGINKIKSYRSISALKKMLNTSLKDGKVKKLLKLIPNDNKTFTLVKQMLDDFDIRERLLNDVTNSINSCIASDGPDYDSYPVYNETSVENMIKGSKQISKKSSTKKSSKKTKTKTKTKTWSKSRKASRGGSCSTMILLLLIVLAYLYGYEQGDIQGSARADRRNRARRDVEIWNEMENLLRYPTPAVERRCMEIVGRRQDVTITRNRRTNRITNRNRLTENNNNNQGSGLRKKKNKTRKNRKK